MQNPEGVAGKVDAAWNYVEQIGLALSIGDIERVKLAKAEASRLLGSAMDELNEQGGAPEASGESVVTCVYCGHQYPDGTPTHKAELLTAHVKVCDKHPMKRVRAALAALVGADTREELQAMRDLMFAATMPAKERAVMVDAIDALIETL